MLVMNILATAATIFTTKADLKAAVQAYDANSTAAIATYGPIAGWNVSAVTDMSWLFYELGNFNADISSWDTSRVTSMAYMFSRASAFNQLVSLDTSSVTVTWASCSPTRRPSTSRLASTRPASRTCTPCSGPHRLSTSR